MIVMPIFAQRLLLNVRQIDYIDSRPAASTLLFAPPPGASIDQPDTLELGSEPLAVGSFQETHGVCLPK